MGFLFIQKISQKMFFCTTLTQQNCFILAESSDKAYLIQIKGKTTKEISFYIT